MAYKGIFKVHNKHKYEGNPHNVIYRSSWENAYMMKLDHDKNVLSWSSESVVIPYRFSVDDSFHRYFVDFKVVRKDPDGVVRTYLYEIKPLSQCRPPKNAVNKRRPTRKMINEHMTYAKNQDKWKYAEMYCAERGWIFKVLTEKELGLW
jgi:hypothetical protein